MFRVLTKALVMKGDSILLLKRKEGGFASGLWDIPGGKLEFGESPEESLIREVYEETTLKVDIGKVISLSSGIDLKKNKQYITIVYLCSYLSGDVKLSNEHIDYEWTSLKNIKGKKLVYYVEEGIDNYLKTLFSNNYLQRQI